LIPQQEWVGDSHWSIEVQSESHVVRVWELRAREEGRDIEKKEEE
jgi:hypothetical protein